MSSVFFQEFYPMGLPTAERVNIERTVGPKATLLGIGKILCTGIPDCRLTPVNPYQTHYQYCFPLHPANTIIDRIGMTLGVEAPDSQTCTLEQGSFFFSRRTFLAGSDFLYQQPVHLVYKKLGKLGVPQNIKVTLARGVPRQVFLEFFLTIRYYKTIVIT